MPDEPSKTTRADPRATDSARDRWLGEMQIFLDRMIEAAPDETCRILARNLWDETAELTDD